MKESDLAYCGLDCSKCPVFIATIIDDDALRQKTAREWTDLYVEILEAVGIDRLKPEDMSCHGCSSESGRFSGCENALSDHAARQRTLSPVLAAMNTNCVIY